VAKTTIVIGILLVLLGIVGYAGVLGGGSGHMTALIPAFFGIVLAALGAIALKPNLRKHAMHAAAMLGVLGLAGTVPGVIKMIKWLGGTTPERSGAVIAQTIMAAICVVFVMLCVQSFIAARRAREAGTTAT
jgi:hypothetical protein